MTEREAPLFTSESVTEGHPDKIADQISDAILDEVLRQDPTGRVACETLVTTDLIVLSGEITTTAQVDFVGVARQTVQEIGYDRPELEFDGSTCKVLLTINRQSPNIAQGVDTGGAGDQGMMFGFACRETSELMPRPIQLAHGLTRRLAAARRAGDLRWLRPDGKAQVTVEYDGKVPVRVDAVVVSTQHDPGVSNDEIHAGVVEKIIKPVIPESLLDGRTKYFINPTGSFEIGGPHGDCGLTGRKIIVDTYGGYGRHGGGAFSGKDPTKVDRSACYMARYIAKNLVAAGIAERVEVQLAYAIGVAEPVSVRVDTFGTGAISDRHIERLVREHFPLSPRGIIDHLELRRPIYRSTAAYGHFGRGDEDGFSWESVRLAPQLCAAAGLSATGVSGVPSMASA